MLNLSNLSSVSGFSGSSPLPWYQSASYLLNNVMPTMVHDYANDRYWNSSAGITTFPFTSTRTSNATMFDSSGNLVWAPANLIALSGVAGAAVGVIGSGGAVPTGWSWATPGAAALTREVVAVGPDYIDVRIYGSNTSGAAVYPSIFLSATPLTAVIGQPICFSMYTQLIAGSFAGVTYAPCGCLSVQFQTGGSYVGNTSVTARATSTYMRYASTGSRATADHNQWAPYFIIGLNNNDTCDFTVRLSSPQFEYRGPDSPKAYNATNGSAYYGPRIGTDSATGLSGLVFEESRTELLPNNVTLTVGDNGTSTAAGSSYLGGWASKRTTANGAASSHFSTYGSITPGASEARAVSAFIKNISNSQWTQIFVSTSHSPANTYVNFDLTNGAVGGVGANARGAWMVDMGGGLYWCGFTYTSIASPANGAGIAISFVTSTSSARAESNSSTGVFDVLFASNTNGEGATTPIPTYYASATRAADNASTTSISWFDQTKGTWYVDFVNYGAVNTLKRIWSISDGTENNLIDINHATSRVVGVRTVIGGTNDYNPATSNSVGAFVRGKAVSLFQSPTKKLVLNGGTVATASVAFPTSGYTKFNVGQKPDLSNRFVGLISEIRYYADTTASDAQLQTLTT